ncbi:MAG: type II toxin-antitoxin system RelE/ParE family toxin [Bacteroidales bacterium]|nr:type II toxin-antitoxin system RelE/ParE family toxin [Bacteroidales bacterium]MCM1416932.1 type II toxin-antitoxin system RelE/ParE family toxin [bacterium]MCM1424625.1 type II toxin-antitoxin system RelE/ParE family toxin [bacterium]
MTKTYIQTKEFSKNWDRLGFDDSDLRRLEAQLLHDADKFPIVRGTGGLRKMRFSFENEGKSGGVRVCYVDFVVEEVIYLITVYPKSEKDNLSQKERNEIKKLITVLKENL